MAPHPWLRGGAFSLGKPLGQGGFGITYLGSDTRLRRPVAIKGFFVNQPEEFCIRQSNTVRPAGKLTIANYRAMKERFLDEALVLARFQHPNIVQVYSSFEENNTAYMVMEYLKGKTLLKLVEERGSLPEGEAVDYIHMVVEALAVVHQANLLHRDIKPDNVMITEDGRVVLVDFGTAREFAAGRTKRMTALLTSGYAPLEQYMERAQFGVFTDIYALGATLYHMLTAQIPVWATDRALGVPLTPPRSLDLKISASVSDAVIWAMEMDVKSRPQSAYEFLSALRGQAAPKRPTSTGTTGQAQLYFPNTSRIDFPDQEVNCGIKREVITYANRGSASLSGTVATDTPPPSQGRRRLLEVAPASLTQNSGDIEVTLDTSQLEWSRSYSHNIIINYNGVDSPKEIPVRFRTKDSKIAEDEVKKLSTVVLVASIVLGLGFTALLASLSVHLTDLISPDFVRPINSIFSVIIFIAMLGLMFAVCAIFGPVGMTIGAIVVIGYILVPDLRNKLLADMSGPSGTLTYFFTNYLGIPIMTATLTGLSTLALRKHSIEFLTRNGTGEGAQTIAGAKILAPSVAFLGVLLLTALLQRGSYSSRFQPSVYSPPRPVQSTPGMLKLGEIQLCSSVSGWKQYQKKAGLAFRPGERLYIYAEALDVNHGGKIDLGNAYGVYDSQGKKILSSRQDRYTITTRSYHYAIWPNFTIPNNWRPGQYQVEVQLRDNVTGVTSSRVLNFTISPSHTRRSPDTAQTYYKSKLSRHNRSQYDQAITEYSEAISRNPDSATTYYGRGLA